MRFSKNMAKTPANVYSLLMGLWEPALEKSKKGSQRPAKHDEHGRC